MHPVADVKERSMECSAPTLRQSQGSGSRHGKHSEPLTGSSDPQDWAIPVSDVEIDTGVIRRIFVRENLKRLRKLAISSKRSDTTLRDLKRLAKSIANVASLQKAGRLRHPSIQS